MLKRIDNGLENRDKDLRVHSLNSLLKDQAFNTIYNPRGLKRLTKVGSRLFNPWNQISGNNNSSDEEIPDSPIYYSRIMKINKPNKIKEDKLGDLKIRELKMGELKMGELKMGESKMGELKMGELKLEDPKLGDSKLGDSKLGDSKLGDSKLGDSKLRDPKSKNSKPGDKVRDQLIDSKLKKSKVQLSFLPFKSLTNEDLESRRIIIIKGFSRGSSPSGVLSRVCGGPIERIVYHENRQDACMEVYFAFPKHAQEFFSYGQTGLLVFNSQHLILEWANETNTEDINLVHPPVPKPLLSQIHNGARKSLLFVKEIPKPYKTMNFVDHPDPQSNYSHELNIKDVLKDFSRLGNIVDYCPVISRKLSFCLMFDDIRSAIMIKKECETLGSKLNGKYKDWFVYYGKDITDRPCFRV